MPVLMGGACKRQWTGLRRCSGAAGVLKNIATNFRLGFRPMNEFVLYGRIGRHTACARRGRSEHTHKLKSHSLAQIKSLGWNGTLWGITNHDERQTALLSLVKCLRWRKHSSASMANICHDHERAV